MGTLAAVLTLLAGPLIATARAEPGPGPRVEATPTVGLDPAGDTVTVTGRGFDPTGNVGTRPPLAGQPAGVYVAFGIFADTWQPSRGAPASSRQVLVQRWVVPPAAYAVLNPLGTNPEVVLMADDGSFTVTLPVSDPGRPAAVAVYPGSGAVNPDDEFLVPLAFGAEPAPTTTVPVTTTTVPATTTTVPVTTTTVPATTTTVLSGGGSRSGTGPTGQTLTVTPAVDLDPTGATVRVSGTGYDPTLGVYVALCVDQGPGVVPSPCVGGADLEGGAGSSAWISSNPPPYGQGLATPFGPGGTFEVDLRLVARDEFVDCLAGAVRCVVATRADHTASTNRSADVTVPVAFVGQDLSAPPTTVPAPTTTATPTTTAAPTTLSAPTTLVPTSVSTPAPAATVAGDTAVAASGSGVATAGATSTAPAALALTGAGVAVLAALALGGVAAGGLLTAASRSRHLARPAATQPEDRS
jgi:hypothetical protein